MRTLQSCPEKPKDIPQDFIRETYPIQVITPIFGGGVEAGKIDPDIPIRPSSIRGHLRFWWRATRGTLFPSIDEMRQREGEIWGSMENPSPVIIEVKVNNLITISPCTRYEENEKGRYSPRWNRPFDGQDNPLPYILFPYQGKPPDSPDPIDPANYIQRTQFDLSINYPDSGRMSSFRSFFNQQRTEENKRRSKWNKLHPDRTLLDIPLLNDAHDDISNDVKGAIWAWVNFGGIGARTRRGCGALYCERFAPANLEQIAQWYLDACNNYGFSRSVTKKWPTIPDKILISATNAGDPLQSWIVSVKLMKQFRQGPRVGRDPRPGGGPRPSRSRWPEAESLRTAVYGAGRRPHGIHPTDHRMLGLRAFPRIEFGMPIILEIRGEGIKPTLQPGETTDRMASPVIVRPLQLNNNTSVSMIFRLTIPGLKTAYIKDHAIGGIINTHEIRDPGLTAYPDSPMSRLSTAGSALDAFVTYAKKNGFTEVP